MRSFCVKNYIITKNVKNERKIMLKLTWDAMNSNENVNETFLHNH